MVESVAGIGVAAVRAGDELPRVRPSFVFVYALAYAGVWLALLTPMLVTIALRVRQLSPENAAGQLALVLGVGAFFALLGNPVFGRWSDRTTSRFGMRRPWLIGGMLCGMASLAIVALAPNIPVLLLGWCLSQLAFNAVLAAIVAVLPDQVPESQRGTVAGVLGICMPIGQVSGTFLVQSLPTSMLMMFLTPAIVGSIAVLFLVALLPDRRQLPSQLPASTLRDFLRSFWLNPVQQSDFAWAWLSRLLLVTGTAFLTTYQSYYLIDKLGYDVAEVPGLIFKSMLVQASMVVISSLLGGRFSDATGRRKIFVIVAAAVYGSGLWTIAAAGDYAAVLIGMALTGVGQGVYFAVDLALVTQILPNRKLDAAKDLGMFNIANALPQSIAPALGPVILWLSRGDYTWLFIVAGSIALLSSIAILPLKGVR
ncbi:MFS transporter [Povalibacter sp.]|uniref:MFS transporter n=1 Tax=Povalibacter sp. TaxID=1962978 RepID=UPI002F40ADEB